MSTIALIVETDTGIALCRIEGVELEWLMMDATSPPVPRNSIPRKVHEIMIDNGLNMFRQVNPEPYIHLTIMEHIKQKVEALWAWR